jgi:predicted MPP superfamily phosphohydrolase
MGALEASLFGGTVARVSHRLGLCGKFGVTRHEVLLPQDKHLPAPLEIAFASDLHAGPTTHPAVFSELIGELSRRRPDVLLLGGDFVTSEAHQAELLADVLSQCRPPLGKYAVLGNHDLWTDDDRITRVLESAGVEVLVNRNCRLPAPFDGVSICGIDDPWTGNADMGKAFAGAGAIRILLTHSPDGLLLLGEERFDLGLAGHTHGGQVALPDGTPILSAEGPLSRSFNRGRFEIAGNGPLIVSLGVGCSNYPIRINCDPELIVCSLRPCGA